jgi:hypothetical protein
VRGNKGSAGVDRMTGRWNGSSSGFSFYGWSGHQAHDCAEITGPVQATNPGHHAKGQGRQHQDDNGRVGHVYAWLARLFRLLPNARGAGRSHSLGPIATAGRSLAPVENSTASPNGTHRTRSLGGVAQHGRQRSWTLASRPEQSPLQIARSPVLDRSALASRTAVCGPVRTVGRGSCAKYKPTARISRPSFRVSPIRSVRSSGGAARLV